MVRFLRQRKTLSSTSCSPSIGEWSSSKICVTGTSPPKPALDSARVLRRFVSDLSTTCPPSELKTNPAPWDHGQASRWPGPAR